MLVAVIASALTFSGAGFFAGTYYQKSKSPKAAGFNGTRLPNGAGGQGGRAFGGNGGFRPVSGEILSVDTGSMTVKMPDGSSRIVLLSDKTTVYKSSSGSKSDLTVGAKVNVSGSLNQDGSVSAQSIQLTPTASATPTQ